MPTDAMAVDASAIDATSTSPDGPVSTSPPDMSIGSIDTAIALPNGCWIGTATTQKGAGGATVEPSTLFIKNNVMQLIISKPGGTNSADLWGLNYTQPGQANWHNLSIVLGTCTCSGVTCYCAGMTSGTTINVLMSFAPKVTILKSRDGSGISETVAYDLSPAVSPTDCP